MVDEKKLTPEEISEALAEVKVNKFLTENKFWNANDLLNSEIKPRFWYIHPIIAKNTLGMFLGKTQSCKTWLVLYLAICLSCGKNWLDDYTTEKTKVLFLDNESDDIECIRRVNMILNGLNLTDNEKKDFRENFFYFNPTEKLNETTLTRALKKKIKENDIKIVFVDSFIEFITHNENDSGENSGFFSKVKRMTKELDLTFVFIHHTGKGEVKKYALDKSRGSSQIIGCVRNAFELKSGENDTSIFEHNKTNICKKIKPIGLKIEFNDEMKSVKFNVISPEEVQMQISLAEKLAGKIEEWIGSKSIKEFKTKDIKINFPTYKENQIYEALKILEEEETIVKISKGKYMVK